MLLFFIFFKEKAKTSEKNRKNVKWVLEEDLGSLVVEDTTDEEEITDLIGEKSKIKMNHIYKTKSMLSLNNIILIYHQFYSQ